ncbi:hypothetical protein LBMAG53_38190 [Planctomycetota bacterium]|nr:hypothetical protein LBMAG53_38190 [Planctomycetota bacterium]
MIRDARAAALALVASLFLAADAPAGESVPISVKDPATQQVVVQYAASSALVIGCAAYKQLPALPEVAEDIKAVSAALERHGFAVTQVLDPTTADLDKSIRTFIGRSGALPDARLVIYFAGHGCTLQDDAGAAQGYLCPVDAPIPDKDDAGFRTAAIFLPDFINRAQQTKSRSVLMAFDVCFSGPLFNQAVPDKPVVSAIHDPVRMFMTAGSANELRPKQSSFRRALIDGIDGKADNDNDGLVLGRELFTYLKKRVADEAAARNQVQTAQYRSLPMGNEPVGDVVFVSPHQQPAAPANPADSPGVAMTASERSRIYAAAEKAEAAEAGVVERWDAWSAVVAAAPSDQNEWSTRDEKLQERAKNLLQRLKPLMVAQTRARALAAAQRLAADENATKRQVRQAWKAVHQVWDVGDDQLTADEQRQVAELEPILSRFDLPLTERSKAQARLAAEQPERERLAKQQARDKAMEQEQRKAHEQVQLKAEQEREQAERERIERERQQRAEKERKESERLAAEARLAKEQDEARQADQKRLEERALASPWAVRRGSDQFGNWADLQIGTISQRFRLIRAGTFQMGDASEGPIHAVTLSAFWLGDSEVTVGLWETVMEGKVSRIAEIAHPMTKVSWDDCRNFFQRLNAQVNGLNATFPSEAQWEYACRAGTTGDFAGEVDQLAWNEKNADGKLHPVKTKAPNAWGLFDLHGNAWEWCGDWYGDYPASAATDPTGPTIAAERGRVRRGGSCNFPPWDCRSANRYWFGPAVRFPDLGLRLAIPATTSP